MPKRRDPRCQPRAASFVSDQPKGITVCIHTTGRVPANTSQKCSPSFASECCELDQLSPGAGPSEPHLHDEFDVERAAADAIPPTVWAAVGTPGQAAYTAWTILAKAGLGGGVA